MRLCFGFIRFLRTSPGEKEHVTFAGNRRQLLLPAPNGAKGFSRGQAKPVRVECRPRTAVPLLSSPEVGVRSLESRSDPRFCRPIRGSFLRGSVRGRRSVLTDCACPPAKSLPPHSGRSRRDESTSSLFLPTFPSKVRKNRMNRM